MKRSSNGIIALVVCISGLLHSCVFAPKDIYKSDDKKNTVTPEVTCTVELNMSQDTVYVSPSTNYSYSSNQIVLNFKCNTGDVLQVISIIDGDEKKAVYYVNDKYPISTTNYSSNYSYSYSSFSSTSNSISVYANDLSLGAHTLELRFLTKSGSGSIADNLGAEGFVTKRWTIIATTNNYSIKDTIKNGFLELNWGAYRGVDFKEYIIKADNGNFIKHLKTNRFIDSSYVGQGKSFDVTLVKTNGTNTFIGSKNYNQELPTVKYVYIKNIGMALKLENNKFYNAIDSIYISLPDYSDSIVIKKKYNQDSIFKINGTLNKSYYGSIKLTPKDRSTYNTTTYRYNYQNYIYSFKLGYSYTPNYYSVNFLAPISNDEFIYSINNELYRYSTSELKQYTPNVKICNKSNYWLSNSKKTLFYLDECDLKQKALSTANGISSLKTYPTSSFSPTSGLLAISDVDTKLTYESQNYRVVVTNMNTGQEIAHSDSIPYSYNISGKMSSNGNYILYSADSKLTLGSVANNSFTKIWTGITLNYIYFEINSENNDEFVYKDGSTFYIKSTKTGEDIINYWLGDEIQSIDFKNNEMLCYNSPYLRIRNLRDGSIINEYKSEYCSRGDVVLSNHVLIFKSGILNFIN